MKKYCLLVVCLIVNSNFGMDLIKRDLDTGQTVTKPYKPSLAAQYPYLPVAIGAASMGLAAYRRASNNGFDNAVNIGLKGGILGASIGWLYSAFKKRSFLDAILLRPQQALRYTYAVRDLFETQLEQENLDDKNKDIDVVRERLNIIFPEFEKKCPIFRLGECTAYNEPGIFTPFTCLLARANEPNYRATYEDQVVAVLINKINTSSKQSVHYASFASGGMFQDLVILTKTLAQKPNAQLVIHCIDLKSTPYVKARDLIDGDHEVTRNSEIFIDSVINDLKDIAKKDWGVQDSDDAQLEKQIKKICYLPELDLKQLITYLQKTFPKAYVSLHVHAEGKEYLEYIQKMNIDYPEVVTTADIQDEMSMLRSGVVDYAELCKEVEKHKPEAINIALLHDNTSAYIGKLATQAKEGYEQVTIGENKEGGFLQLNKIQPSLYNQIMRIFVR